MCKRVLLPAPDSPTIASISPRFTSNDRFSKSTRSDSPDRKTFFKPTTRRIKSSLLRCTLGLFRSTGRLDVRCQVKQYSRDGIPQGFRGASRTCTSERIRLYVAELTGETGKNIQHRVRRGTHRTIHNAAPQPGECGRRTKTGREWRRRTRVWR